MSCQGDDDKSSWAEICRRHHDEWVLLTDVEYDDARTVTFARVVDHDESVIDIMDRNDSLPGTVLIQTAGRPLWWLTRPRLILEADEEVPGLAPGATFTVGKPRPERVAKLCHGAADPLGSVRTRTDEETR
jgi:hypothetical protein